MFLDHKVITGVRKLKDNVEILAETEAYFGVKDQTQFKNRIALEKFRYSSPSFILYIEHIGK